MPELSVLIPVYNRAAYVASAIESIRAQRDAPSLEILVVDDGSTDDTLARVAAIDDPRIRVLEGEHNQGIAAARNRGIAAAAGRYTAFLDSDDVARPDRLAAQTTFLSARPDHAAVGAWIGWIDDDGARLSRIKRKPRTYRMIAAERLFRSGIENSTAMARTEILRAYPHDETLVVGSDYDLWARIAGDHPVASLPRLLVDRRAHATQATAENVERDRYFRCQVFARQLDALGVSYDTTDLHRHYRLRRLKKAGDQPDNAYLDWAERWLSELRRANQTLARYPEPEFSGLLALFWASACWHATTSARETPTSMGTMTALGRLWRHPLARALPTGAWQGWLHRQPQLSRLAARYGR